MLCVVLYASVYDIKGNYVNNVKRDCRIAVSNRMNRSTTDQKLTEKKL